MDTFKLDGNTFWELFLSWNYVEADLSVCKPVVDKLAPMLISRLRVNLHSLQRREILQNADRVPHSADFFTERCLRLYQLSSSVRPVQSGPSVRLSSFRADCFFACGNNMEGNESENYLHPPSVCLSGYRETGGRWVHHRHCRGHACMNEFLALDIASEMDRSEEQRGQRCFFFFWERAGGGTGLNGSVGGCGSK